MLPQAGQEPTRRRKAWGATGLQYLREQAQTSTPSLEVMLMRKESLCTLASTTLFRGKGK